MSSSITSVGKSSRLHPIEGGDPTPSTIQRTKSIVVAVAEGNRKPSADLWLLLNGLWEELQDPNVIIYVLTEYLDRVEEWLCEEVKATIVVGKPTSTNIMFAIEGAVSRCAVEGKLLLWICCLGRPKELTNRIRICELRPMDGWDNALTGEDLRRSILRLPPTCVVTVVLEICYAGNLLGGLGLLTFPLPCAYSSTNLL
ncbi:hypothetical protein FRB93_007070 [Tulasnella sp. JGI-2019a]|nr:hypothetical protein FRB93_007070 [Tulasnella sp. JGI-2019a]